MMKNYSIAGLTVAMDVTGRTLKQAEPYRCGDSEEADILLNGDFREYQKVHPSWDEDDALYVYTCSCFYTELIRFQGLMLHSSSVVVDGKAYLFSAVSGTGKSTHTRLWREMLGDRALMVNDDKPALRLIDGVWYACGTPWSGKHDISKPVCVPLAGIAMVNRDSTNHIHPHGGAKAVYDLLSQTIRPADKRLELLELLDKLVSQIPVWKLYCNMDPEAALVAYDAMSGAEKE